MNKKDLMIGGLILGTLMANVALDEFEKCSDKGSDFDPKYEDKKLKQRRKKNKVAKVSRKKNRKGNKRK